MEIRKVTRLKDPEGEYAKRQHKHKFLEKISSGIAQILYWSSTHPKAVMACVIVLMLFSAYGMSNIKTVEDVNDMLPVGNPCTNAARKMSVEFQEYDAVVTMYITIDPSKWEAANAKLPYRVQQVPGSGVPFGQTPDANNATDEVYIRATDEIAKFMMARLSPPLTFVITPASTVKLLNYTTFSVPGNLDMKNYAMPGTGPDGEMQYAIDWAGVTIDPSALGMFSKDFKTLQIALMSEPGTMIYGDLGKKIMNAVEEYKQACKDGKMQYDVFMVDGRDAIPMEGFPVLEGYAAQVDDVEGNRNMLLVVTFIIVCVFIAFRNVRATFAAVSSLIVGTVFTMGMMGYLGLPLGGLSEMIIPLILGCGIDLSLHTTNEYLEHHSQGKTGKEVFMESAKRSGVALLITLTTTIAGLILMIFSPSASMMRLGMVSTLGMCIIFLLAISYVPACLALLKAETKIKAKEYRPSKFMISLSNWLGTHKKTGVAIIILITAVSIVGSSYSFVEPFGNPEMGYPKGTMLRDWASARNERFYGGVGDNLNCDTIIFEGDMTDPAVHQYIRALSANLLTCPDGTFFSANDATVVIDGYLVIRYGTAGAPVTMGTGYMPFGMPQGTPSGQYPTTKEGMKALLDEMFAGPMGHYLSMFLNDKYEMGLIDVWSTMKSNTFQESERLWNQEYAMIQKTDNELGRPNGLEIHTRGLTTFSYLFITQELPWLGYISLVSLIAVIVLVALATRDLKAIATVGIVMWLTSLWWLGVIPFFNIGLSVTLMLPAVFIMCMGSDYSVHLVWNIRQTRDPKEVYGSTGKAVLYSAITTLGAFAIFSWMTSIVSARAMLAVVIAIVAIYICTILVVPIIYHEKEDTIPHKYFSRKKSSIKVVVDDRRVSASPAKTASGGGS
ncbi:MAG: MMPL family transporter, partial [Candidatus Thermoplasmatota archaeon]|nr:MMPL family transporter [Candidatus Thermoplasmatota archaeon]